MTNRYFQSLTLFLALTLLLAITPSVDVAAETIEFRIESGEPNVMKFTSKAPLETIVGVTNQVSGTVTIDPDDVAQNVSAKIVVQMADIDTDNGVRNGHMRENHLHTDKYPTSVFILESIEGLSTGGLPDGRKVSFRAKGKFTLHGVTRAIEPEIDATWNAAAKSLDVTARFPVLLDDYDIPRPQFLFMKLSKEQKVEIKFSAYAK